MAVEYRCDPIEQKAINANRITVSSIIDHFPTDAIGGSNKRNMASRLLTLRWRHCSVETDLPKRRDSDRLRGFIRARAFPEFFYEDSGAEAGDVIIFERLGTHEFRLHLQKPDGRRFG